jgi:multidrug efflux pump
MKFTDIFIKRPTLAVVICLIILLLGTLSYLRLPLRQFPKMDTSVINIRTNYPGASADVIENFVTSPIESAVAGIEGIDYISSTSAYGQSNIKVNLFLGYDVNVALSDINTQISSVRSNLPPDINSPIVQTHDPNDIPVYFLSFITHKLAPIDMGNYLTTVISPILSSLSGVGEVDNFGPSTYAMRIWLDPQLMAARNITALDVYNTLNKNNVQATSGQITNNLEQYDVYASTDLHTAKQFNQLVIKQQNEVPIRLNDIGYAVLGAQHNNTYSVYSDGQSSNILQVLPSSTANPLLVANEIKHVIPKIEQVLPKDIKLLFSHDMTVFISASIHDVYRTLIESIIIIFFVIFLILGSWRAVCVPLVAIPLSIIGACALLFVLNYSINTLTLLAFVLAIGLVVDDAIVVTENIHRHILSGQPPLEAAINGAREIRFAVIAMTLTLACAYLPIGFTSGLTGILFTEFAFTLACTVIISGIVALVLSPMMCSKIMTMQSCTSGFAGKLDYLFDKIHIAYKKILIKCIAWRWIVIAFAICIYVMGIFLFTHLKSELAPPEDQGFLYTILQAPISANLNYTEKYSEKINRLYMSNPAVEHSIIINGSRGVNTANAIAILKPWDERKTSAFNLMRAWAPLLWSIPGVTAYPFNRPALPGTSGFHAVDYVIKTTDSYENLAKVSQQFVTAVNQWGGLTHVDSDLKIDSPSLQVSIDRPLAADLGIPMSTIGKTLSIFLGQPTTTRFSINGQNYEVLPEVQDFYQNNPKKLNEFYLPTNNGSNELIPLSNVAHITEAVSPESLGHFQQLRAATISGGLAPGVTLGDALKHLNDLANTLLPKGYNHDYAQQLRQYVDASGKMGEVFGFAVIFIYLILAAQFESFVDPIIVMLSVPLSLTGALLLLKLTGITLNIYTEIGLVTLLGLMSKQTILIVEFANQLQERGIEFKEAILEGSCQRLKPIVMTSLAMVLGALPLVLAHGAGAISRFEIGLTIVSGLGIGTILTLLIIPVVYYLFASKKEITSPPMEEVPSNGGVRK